MPHKAIWVNEDATQVIKDVEGNYKPGQDEVLLKSLSVGLNQGDWKHAKDFGAVNTVLGFDAVGEIVELGPDVKHLKIGQKVATFVRMGPAPYGASQEYFLTQASCSWPFDPNLLTDDQAATIPLTLCTAGDALYNKMRPPIPMPDEKPCGRPILIWGAENQVGMNAVQLAKKGGCRPVIATASSQQHEYIKSLGAEFVFDYRDPEISSKILEALQGQPLPHAFDAVGSDDSTLHLLESLVSPRGDIILALPPTRPFPNHNCEMCIAGTIHNLPTYNMPQFKFHERKEPPKFDEGARKLQWLIRWAFDGAGTEYVVPRVRRVGNKGMQDALRGFEMMKQGEIRGEKIVYRVRETPGI